MSWSERLRRLDDICRSRGFWLLGVVVTAVSSIWLFATRYALITNFDTARDWNQAVSCANGHASFCEGTPEIWFHGFSHGALWIRFLGFGHRLDLSVAALQGLTLLFIAVACGFITNAARHWMSVLGAVVAGLVFAPLSLSVTQAYVFWNPTLLPLPLAIFAWALSDHVRTGRAATGIAAAIALGVSVDLHLVCVVLVPLLFIANVASVRRLGVSNALAMFAFGLTLWLAAPNSWARNLEALDRLTMGPVLVGALLPLATVIGLVVRGRWRGAEPSSSVALLVGAMMTWVVVLYASEGLWIERYVAPSLPAVALGFGWLFGRVRFDWRSLARLTIGMGLLWKTDVVRAGSFVPAPDQWTLEDVSRVARALAEKRWGGPDLWTRVGGLGENDLATLVALSKPHPSPPDGSVVIARTHRSALPTEPPPTWEIVELEAGHVAILEQVASAVSRERVEMCSVVEGRAPFCKSEPLVPDPSVFEFPLLRRVFGEVVSKEITEPFRLEYWLDLDTGKIDAPSIVAIVDEDEDWKITAVRGVGYDGELPGRSVKLLPGSGRGRIALARPIVREDGIPPWMPTLVESPEGELRRLFKGYAKPIPPAPEAESLRTP